jgi:hypothetical protein
LQLWLTKDDMMVPQTLGNGTERGYYVFFDIKHWHRERVSEGPSKFPNRNTNIFFSGSSHSSTMILRIFLLALVVLSCKVFLQLISAHSTAPMAYTFFIRILCHRVIDWQTQVGEFSWY